MVFVLLPGGPPPKKRGRGRPRRSDTLARQQAEVKPEPQPEEPEDDDIVDAGAIDDPEGTVRGDPCHFRSIIVLYRNALSLGKSR